MENDLSTIEKKFLAIINSKIVVGNKGVGDVLAAKACSELLTEEIKKALKFSDRINESLK